MPSNLLLLFGFWRWGNCAAGWRCVSLPAPPRAALLVAACARHVGEFYRAECLVSRLIFLLITFTII